MRHGFLLIDKPTGPTSHDCVRQIRKRLHETKVGHLGTLDPAASGLLVLAVGAKALKVIEFFNELPKEYIADIAFGSVSSTYDREGVIEKVARKPGVEIPDESQVRRAIENRFVGKIEQIPPAYSAVHVEGHRAHELARKGVNVSLSPRQVEIAMCDVVSYAYPNVKLRIACGSGTYIRSLAHDLGQVLRVGGYLSALRRTRVGKWTVEEAEKPDNASWTNIIPLKDVLENFPSIEVTDEEAQDIQHGRSIPHEVKPDTLAWHNGLPIALLVPQKDGSQACRPRKVL